MDIIVSNAALNLSRRDADVASARPANRRIRWSAARSARCRGACTRARLALAQVDPMGPTRFTSALRRRWRRSRRRSGSPAHPAGARRCAREHNAYRRRIGRRRLGSRSCVSSATAFGPATPGCRCADDQRAMAADARRPQGAARSAFMDHVWDALSREGVWPATEKR